MVKAALRTFLIKKTSVETPTCKTLKLFPVDKKPFSFSSGQFINVYLPKDGKRMGECRSYTIANSPGEKTADFTFRVKADFTKRLWKMKAGEKLLCLGPLGKFTFEPDDFIGKRVVFIAGGIGVAGFTSAIRHAIGKKLPIEITLFYSERIYGDIPFEKELLARKKEGLRMIQTLTGPVPKGWEGLIGRINGKMLEENLLKEDLKGAIFYVCGSDLFVKDISSALKKLRIPAKRIRSEGFG